jgi:hypothetical protein
MIEIGPNLMDALVVLAGIIVFSIYLYFLYKIVN